jgi:hypothetical protein
MNALSDNILKEVGEVRVGRKKLGDIDPAAREIVRELQDWAQRNTAAV